VRYDLIYRGPSPYATGKSRWPLVLGVPARKQWTADLHEGRVIYTELCHVYGRRVRRLGLAATRFDFLILRTPAPHRGSEMPEYEHGSLVVTLSSTERSRQEMLDLRGCTSQQSRPRPAARLCLGPTEEATGRQLLVPVVEVQPVVNISALWLVDPTQTSGRRRTRKQ